MKLSGKRIAFKPVAPPEEKTESGIYLPETSRDEFIYGEVIAVGDGCKDELKQSKVIFVNEGRVEKAKWEGKECKMTLEDSIIGYE